MKTLLLIILIFMANVSSGQTNTKSPAITFKIDTLIFTKDTTNLFIREIWDTSIVKTYYCSVDSADKSFRYGFLHLKKGIVREYFFKNIHNIKNYPRPKSYEGYRGPETQPITILRLK